jgi:hypothetical protein
LMSINQLLLLLFLIDSWRSAIPIMFYGLETLLPSGKTIQKNDQTNTVITN